MNKNGNEFSITVVPLPQVDDPLGHPRLRMAVKTLRRRFGLRCTEVRAVERLSPMPDGEYSYRFPIGVVGAHEPVIGESTRDLPDERAFARL